MLNVLFHGMSYLPLSITRQLARIIGSLLMVIPNREKAVAYTNITRCFPALSEKQTNQLVKATLIDNSHTLLELPRLLSKGGDYALSLIHSVNGQDYFDDALASGNGVILLAPHLGNWEVTIHYFNQFTPMTAMFAPPKQAFLNDILKNARESTGAKLVPTNLTGVRALIKALRAGQVIGILPDQQPKSGQGGVFADFMGQTAYTMTLVNQLLKRQPATVLFVFAKRSDDGKGFEINILPSPADLDHDDEVIAATALNQGVTNCLQLAPSQYQWTYKRFKVQPQNQPSPYDS